MAQTHTSTEFQLLAAPTAPFWAVLGQARREHDQVGWSKMTQKYGFLDLHLRTPLLCCVRTREMTFSGKTFLEWVCGAAWSRVIPVHGDGFERWKPPREEGGSHMCIGALGIVRWDIWSDTANSWWAACSGRRAGPYEHCGCFLLWAHFDGLPPFLHPKSLSLKLLLCILTLLDWTLCGLRLHPPQEDDFLGVLPPPPLAPLAPPGTGL